jgi:hypothetical protein
MLFGLKNVGATFEWAMSCAFQDIKHIVESFLDDLTTYSKKQAQHITHLHVVFEKCRYYKIHLNPHRYIFCVEFGRLLGFIMSKHEIMVDPLKIEVIVQLSPPRSIHYI